MSGEVVLMGDPRVAAVPAVECGESLLTAGEQFVRSARKADQEPYRSRVRAGLLDRLEHAAGALPAGVRFMWVEGHRRAARQEHYFQLYRARLLADDPGLAAEDVDRLTSRFVSPVEVAPHVSGAAIDLTLCDESGAELDLGTAVDATPEESAGACYFAAAVNAEARRNRELLAAVLTGAGLVNYPTEWWHWSYGDRYWALLTERPEAVYGPWDPVE